MAEPHANDECIDPGTLENPYAPPRFNDDTPKELATNRGHGLWIILAAYAWPIGLFFTIASFTSITEDLKVIIWTLQLLFATWALGRSGGWIRIIILPATAVNAFIAYGMYILPCIP